MNKPLAAAALFCACATTPALAGIDKVYSPNVELNEVELEMRGVHGTSDDFHKVKFGFGYGATAHWFVEGYLVGEKEDGNFDIEEAEIESKFQLSEQGQYWADFGLLVEIEKKLDDDVWEFKAGPIIQKQFGRYVATANLLVERQFGSDTDEDETEFMGSFQLKYRMGSDLEPGIEYYGDEHTNALGPVLLGSTHFADTKAKWEFGTLFGLDDENDDLTIRWNIEWEF